MFNSILLKKKNINTEVFYNKNIFIFFYKIYKIFNILNINIKFTGKTFKWSLLKKIFFLNFNKTNKLKIFFKNYFIYKNFYKFKKKIFFNLKKDLYLFYRYIYFIRRYNIFTQRGLKLNKIYIWKKKGKISTYR